MLIDSHAHIYNEYYDDISAIVNFAIKRNVLKIINCATSINNFNEIIELSHKYENFYYVLGVHPGEISDSINIEELESFVKLNLNNPKFIGIGEIGLDYYYSKDNKNNQIKLFKAQLSLAEKYELPVIIHSREATEETIKILKNYSLKGIIHCFSGSIEIAKEYIKLGYKLGIGGLLTFKNSNLKNYIKNIGIHNIVLETDSPYMTPEPFRKYKNEPKYIFEIAEEVSKIFKISIEKVAEITTYNCNKIFDFNNKK